MRIYKPKVVKELRKFYGIDLLVNSNEIPFVKDYLLSLAKRMLEGVQEGHAFIFQEINNYHKSHLGQPINELKKMKWTLENCQEAIANEHGFKNWNAIDSDLKYDKGFEVAVDFLLNGQFDDLKKCLNKDSGLIFRKSQFGHQATLLHYVGSNGVEFWRQVVPYRLPEMTKYLIKKGANKNAKMKVYGGEFSVLPLLESSAHPYQAGLVEEMIEILK